MSVIIVGQPYELRLDTGISLSAATQPKIAYRKPDKTTGELAATISNTELVASVTGALNNQSGEWCFHASVLFVGDDAPLLGDVASINVKSKYYRKL